MRVRAWGQVSTGTQSSHSSARGGKTRNSRDKKTLFRDIGRERSGSRIGGPGSLIGDSESLIGDSGSLIGDSRSLLGD